MVCLYCGSGTKVTNSRKQRKLNQTWRRRACQDCGAVTTSVESVDLEKSVVVVDDYKQLEPFSRDKLFISVYNACKHRKTAISDATGLTATIIAKLGAHVTNAQLEKAEIIQMVTAILKRFDTAAGVQYTAYHPLATT